MKRLLKFLVDDLRSDIEFLKKAYRGEAKIKQKAKKLLDINWMFKNKTIYLMFLVIIIVFLCGFFLGEQKTIIQCDKIVNNITLECNKKLYSNDYGFNISAFGDATLHDSNKYFLQYENSTKVIKVE